MTDVVCNGRKQLGDCRIFYSLLLSVQVSVSAAKIAEETSDIADEDLGNLKRRKVAAISVDTILAQIEVFLCPG